MITLKTGYLAVFDILGYREMTRDRESLVATIGQIKKNKRTMKAFAEVDKNCTFSMFADTLVISSPSSISPMFPVWCYAFFRAMLRSGMPLRGAIAKGDYFHDGNLYGGAALSDAHELAESLDFAGCILAPSAEDLAASKSDWFRLISVPIKGAGKCKMYVLRLADSDLADPALCRQAVRKSFEGFGKRITAGCLSKLTNTVEVLSEAAKKSP